MEAEPSKLLEKEMDEMEDEAREDREMLVMDKEEEVKKDEEMVRDEREGPLTILIPHSPPPPPPPEDPGELKHCLARSRVAIFPFLI